MRKFLLFRIPLLLSVFLLTGCGPLRSIAKFAFIVREVSNGNYTFLWIMIGGTILWCILCIFNLILERISAYNSNAANADPVRKRHVAICKGCTKSKQSRKGIVCSLTNEYADFGEECPHYDSRIKSEMNNKTTEQLISILANCREDNQKEKVYYIKEILHERGVDIPIIETDNINKKASKTLSIKTKMKIVIGLGILVVLSLVVGLIPEDACSLFTAILFFVSAIIFYVSIFTLLIWAWVYDFKFSKILRNDRYNLLGLYILIVTIFDVITEFCSLIIDNQIYYISNNIVWILIDITTIILVSLFVKKAKGSLYINIGKMLIITNTIICLTNMVDLITTLTNFESDILFIFTFLVNLGVIIYSLMVMIRNLPKILSEQQCKH